MNESEIKVIVSATVDSLVAGMKKSEGAVKGLADKTDSLSDKLVTTDRSLDKVAASAKKVGSEAEATSGKVDKLKTGLTTGDQKNFFERLNLSPIGKAFGDVGSAATGAGSSIVAAGAVAAAGLFAIKIAADAVIGAIRAADESFKAARDSALKLGNKEVVSEIDSMYASIEGVKQVLLSVPVAGSSFLGFMGEAATRVENVTKGIGLSIIKYQEYIGILNGAQAAEATMNLVHAEQIALMNELRSKVTDAATATDLLRAANRKAYDDYRTSLQQGYINYALERASQAGVTSVPTRDIGGRGSPGQPVVIGTGAQPEVYVPDSPGTFYPKGSGAANGGGWNGGGQTIVINAPITIQGVVGNRADAIRHGNQTVSGIARALGRAGSVPNGGPTRG